MGWVPKPDICAKLQQCFTCQRLGLYNDLAYQQLQLLHWHPVVTYYLATPSNLCGIICHNLYQSGAISEHSRILLEKPIGHDLQSAQQINDQIGRYFTKRQIYRIDHYLGKETVQNLLALRFADPLFGNQWNQNHIAYVEITVAESVGIEGRWDYFDHCGQMRDMVQNHLLQLLCLVAMEPPSKLEANSIRDEKVKVLKALQPIPKDAIAANLIRGQYGAGKHQPGYLEEVGSNTHSHTETFVALKANIANWRWAGAPFYLRTGKRMREKLTEIVIHFKPNAHFVFDAEQQDIASNKLVIRLQPYEGISLQMLTKEQGINKGMRLRCDPLQLDFGQTQQHNGIPDAYERLLLECLKGNQSLFVRHDEVEEAWRWCDHVINLWHQTQQPLHHYPVGSDGPNATHQLLKNYGHRWHDDH